MALSCIQCGKKRSFMEAMSGDLLADYSSYICDDCKFQSKIKKERVRESAMTLAVTTAFEFPDHRIVRHIGIVRGIIVRSRSVLGTVGASLQTIVGGDITLFTELCEQTRKDAFEAMLEHAAKLEANAVIGFRYDATEIATGVTEVLAYGTAVVVESASSANVQ